MWWRAHDGMGLWMVFGGLIWVLFWGALVYLLFSLVRRDHGVGPEPRQDPLEVAKLRYAKGEIGREELETIREYLRGAAS